MPKGISDTQTASGAVRNKRGRKTAGKSKVFDKLPLVNEVCQRIKC